MGRRRPGSGLSTAGQAVRFLGVSVLSGAVLAGLALPAVGALGLAAKGTAQGFDEIPAMMKRPPLSQRTTILDAEGNKIADVYHRNRTVIGLDDMGEYVRQAIVAIEDARFYEHGAVDFEGIIRALNNNLEAGGVSEGASTLTQQYVKNVFVEAAGDDQEAIAEATDQSGADGLGRKVREMKYAIELEQELSKDEILENYLNITYFGQQAYGIEAASRQYFSKPASELELHEAAMLAGLVQSPSAYDPVTSPEAARARRDTVLQAMVRTGDITQREADEAKALDLGLKLSEPRNGCITAVNDAGFFCDYVHEEFLSSPVFGETREKREEMWALGGLTIRTTLDPQAQSAAAAAAVNGVNTDDPVASSVVQVEPGTGRILSMAQSRPYGNDAEAHETIINLNASNAMGGSTYGFQPGSTFKPITAAAALEAGMSPAKTYTTDNEMVVQMSDFRDCEGTPLGEAGNSEWDVENYDESMQGTWDMTDALAQSVNTYFVELEKEVGVCETAELAARMGIERGDNKPLGVNPSMTLGGEEIAPLQMAAAYATFANRGTYCEPVSITSVTTAGGEELAPESDCSQVMSARTADTINMMLRGVVEDGTGATAGLTDRDNAGKTGTTDDVRDVWFVGYTPEVATAVRVGSDTDPLPMFDITIGGVFHEQASGGAVAGPIWHEAMAGALAGVPASTFTEVDVPRADDPVIPPPDDDSDLPDLPGLPEPPDDGGGDGWPGDWGDWENWNNGNGNGNGNGRD
ncbi:transglycosylase domain-containing protein [Streptomyces sp. 6N223]|uniref:transglycosylase domain-containing protein n=1 Tax=Streptomyces sp. 6N223 TaxID=3457412 RepID=UPI003FD12FA2